MRRKAGFLLVFALLLTVLITIIALGLLGLKKGGYASSRAAINAVQARSLARSGMSDVWTKLTKDPFFPGGLGDDQRYFTYREEMTDSGGRNIGSYRVAVDRTYRFTHQLVRIEVTGVSGQLDSESSHHTIYAELSIDPNDYRFKVWQEGIASRL